MTTTNNSKKTYYMLEASFDHYSYVSHFTCEIDKDECYKIKADSYEKAKQKALKLRYFSGSTLILLDDEMQRMSYFEHNNNSEEEEVWHEYMYSDYLDRYVDAEARE